jgi:hypothetical protein
MINLEQVKLLESQVIKTIEYVDKVTEENNLLRGKLETYQKRIDELEVVVQRFKEDYGQIEEIEEGILSSLNRLTQFRTKLESGLSPEKIRENTASAKDTDTQTETGDLADLLSGRDEEDEIVDLSLSGKDSPFDTEEAAEDGLIIEPETDDLPGDEEEASEETLNPGELDIF